jgi:Fe-S-cluster containining protein
MKLQVLAGENFSCRSCTNCCRGWHVELMGGEMERILGLAWPGGDPLLGVEAVLKHGGRIYLGHRGDGACLFLNESSGLCRIHEEFGVEAKPLGCRVFPFQIAATFADQASVIGRFDCPTVRQNLGAPHLEELATLRRYAGQLGISGGFDVATCCHLERDQIEAVCEFIGTLTEAFDSNPERVLFMAYLCDWLEQTGADELDRELLAKVFPKLKLVVEAAMTQRMPRPNWFVRISFRTLLGLYMRRDEDVLDGRCGRYERLLALMGVIFGFGNFQKLGLSHRYGKLRKAGLFKPTLPTGEAGVFALYWRLVRIRLESFQFMGSANDERNFLVGLRSLALLFPLVAAVAKYSAGNRNSAKIEMEDVDFAVGAIEHSFGRLAILKQSWMRSIEKLLMEPKTFTRLVRNI